MLRMGTDFADEIYTRGNFTATYSVDTIKRMEEKSMSHFISRSIFVVSLLMFPLLFAAPKAFADDAGGNANIQEELRALKDRVKHLEGVEQELTDLKARMAKLETQECTPAQQEVICKKVDAWFNSNSDRLIDDLSRHGPKTTLFGCDIEFHGYMTGVYQDALSKGIVMSGNGHKGTRRDAITYRLGLGMTVWLDEAHKQNAFITFRAGDGSGIDQYVPNHVGLNGAALNTVDSGMAGNSGTNTDVRLYKAGYEGAFFGDKLIFTAGKLDMTNYFDTNAVANDEMHQFVTAALVNNPSIGFPADTTPGIRALYSPFGAADMSNADPKSTDWLLLQMGLMQNPDEQGTRDGMVIGEAWIKAQKTPWLKNIIKRPGNYRFGTYLNENDSATLKEQEAGFEKGGASLTGFYTSMDQEIFDNVTAFFRYGLADKDVAPNYQFVSYGVQFGGDIWGRKDDYIGVGAAHNIHNPRAKNVDPPEFATNECVYEIYYNYKAAKFLQVTPFFQILDHQEGIKDANTGVIGGLRLQLDF